ncbi:hypothetical protein DFP72DRAFT_262621 [Ephemerocybe angulata]|uniref:Uncharacterized protein n=1 Tax=Ephemerocybe angulata TaxID=980116 RepID=A0A8H6MAB8_9AGAR|nr:hypothetical protein DFP72DRAFT_262621 [Tulosesus angulatus]
MPPLTPTKRLSFYLFIASCFLHLNALSVTCTFISSRECHTMLCSFLSFPMFSSTALVSCPLLRLGNEQSLVKSQSAPRLCRVCVLECLPTPIRIWIS